MARLREWTEKIREDVNLDDSMLISAFEKTTDFLFIITILLGLPFVLYVFIQFYSLF
jgi:hypothetical protein